MFFKHIYTPHMSKHRQNSVGLCYVFVYNIIERGGCVWMAEGDDAEWDLPVHHGSVSLLPGEHTALAELAATQSVLQRLFHQTSAPTRPTRQGQLLGSAPGLRRHVRQRQLSEASKTLQSPALPARPPRVGVGAEPRRTCRCGWSRCWRTVQGFRFECRRVFTVPGPAAPTVRRTLRGRCGSDDAAAAKHQWYNGFGSEDDSDDDDAEENVANSQTAVYYREHHRQRQVVDVGTWRWSVIRQSEQFRRDSYGEVGSVYRAPAVKPGQLAAAVLLPVVFRTAASSSACAAAVNCRSSVATHRGPRMRRDADTAESNDRRPDARAASGRGRQLRTVAAAVRQLSRSSRSTAFLSPSADQAAAAVSAAVRRTATASSSAPAASAAAASSKIQRSNVAARRTLQPSSVAAVPATTPASSTTTTADARPASD